MRTLIVSFLSALTALAVFSLAASAQTLIDAKDPEVIRNLASGYGSATLTTTSDGEPKIVGRVDGIQYLIYFYGCEAQINCDSIQFSAAWLDVENFTAETASEWNLTRRIGKAFVDGDGDPWLQWDVNLVGGVSLTNIDDTIDWWIFTLKQFTNFMRDL